MRNIKDLFEVFPDAQVIFLKRKMESVMMSWGHLVTLLRRRHGLNSSPSFPDIDPIKIGHDMANSLSDDLIGYYKGISQLTAEQKEQIVDVDYDDLLKDPCATLRGIYAKFNFDFTNETADHIASWLKDNPSDKYGRTSYDLATYGLTLEDLRKLFPQLYRDK